MSRATAVTEHLARSAHERNTLRDFPSSRRQRRRSARAKLFEYARAIESEDALSAGALGFMARLFVQVGLPYHKPWNCPPESAYKDSEDVYPQCDPAVNPTPDDLDAYRGQMWIVDEQLDLLLESSDIDLTPTTGDTYVFLVSDNGTPGDDLVSLAPFDDEDRVKGTVYEGGVRVPMFVAGPDVVDGDLDEDLFINVSDLYATILELSGETVNPNDTTWERNQSQSFLDYMTDSTPDRIRECAFTELFKPNGIGGTKSVSDFTIVGTNDVDTKIYKYLSLAHGTGIGLYDMTNDFAEETNLCGALGCDSTEDDIIDDLVECADQFRDVCTDAELGESCASDTCCPGLFCHNTTLTCTDAI